MPTSQVTDTTEELNRVNTKKNRQVQANSLIQMFWRVI
uniref:Uncharacterized protein n=1 Tax=Rhizophora mucronata TaxID=61149 RepID=A0A2P2QZG3_RHIMU